MAERKDIYLAKHPQTKHGGAPGAGRGKKKVPKETKVDSFSADTAKKTGKSKTTVKRDIQIGTALSAEVRDLLRDTDVADNQSELLKLARMDPAEQTEVAAHRLMSGRV